MITVTRSALPYDALATGDPVLARLVECVGEPDPFEFPDGGRAAQSPFAGMVLHILSQQISVTVALVVFDRLVAAVGGALAPEQVVHLHPEHLRALGMSNAKASYVLDLAARIQRGNLDLDALQDVSDDDAITALTAVRGIGPWSAQMFLIHQLKRPDVFPAGDLGIRIAVQKAFRLDERPSIDDVRRLGEAWSPHRTYAAALLWGSLLLPEPG